MSHLCFYPESNDKLVTKAGLLTYFTFVAFPFLQQWQRIQKLLLKLTASGNVRDLHPVPFSFLFAVRTSTAINSSRPHFRKVLAAFSTSGRAPCLNFHLRFSTSRSPTRSKPIANLPRPGASFLRSRSFWSRAPTAKPRTSRR